MHLCFSLIGVSAFITINRHVAGDRTSNLTAPDVRLTLKRFKRGHVAAITAKSEGGNRRSD